MFTWMRKVNQRLLMKLKNTGKKSLIVYFVLRLLVLLCLTQTFFRKDYDSTFLCLVSLLLFTIPTLLEDTFNITLPSVLESIVYLFIFSAEILGEINNFYFMIPHWDTILHTLNGFLAAGVGFSLVDILNRNRIVNLSPLFVAIVGSYLLSTTSTLTSFGFGELLSIASAIFFALQILFVDRACKYLNPYKFCMIQIGVVTIFSFIMMLILEKKLE